MNADHEDPDLSALIRRDATRHAAGDRLRAAIRTQVALADLGRSEARTAAPRGFGWRSAAAGFVCGLAVAFAAVRWWPHDAGIESELVADHVRALQDNAIVEVASSDRHTVKPWFQGRLDYAPPVVDLTDDGYPLAGGRVERVRDARVAVLAYRHRRHVVDVYVWPSEGALPPSAAARRGFNLLHAADASMQVWIVSDADAAELQRFWAAWQAAAAKR
jgi:anti-sigma factor RsiW